MTQNAGVMQRLQNHWTWRPDWRADRSCLWWYLTFAHEPEVVALGGDLGSALHGCTALDVVPSSCLHLTLREVGYLDEVSPYRIDQMVHTARARLADVPAFDLDLAAPAILPGAVVLQAQPAAVIEQLRTLLPGLGPRPAHQEHGPSPTTEMPHMSIAYLNRDWPSSAIMSRIPRTVPPVRVRVDHVVLAAVTRRRRHYQWTVRDHVPLSAPSTVPNRANNGSY